MIERTLNLYFHIDTNKINARRLLPNMNILQQWHVNNVISISMSEIAQTEAGHAGQLQEDQASTYLANTDENLEDKEIIICKKIAMTLFPGGVDSQNKGNDVKIVFHAFKYKKILITNDGGSRNQPGGILGNRHILKERYNIDIMTDEEAVDYVRCAIRNRDDAAKECGQTNSWIGQD